MLPQGFRYTVRALHRVLRHKFSHADWHTNPDWRPKADSVLTKSSKTAEYRTNLQHEIPLADFTRTSSGRRRAGLSDVINFYFVSLR